MVIHPKVYSSFPVLLIAMAVLIGCNHTPKDADSPEKPDTTHHKNDHWEKPDLIEVDGEMFSIPSPVQMVVLLKGSGMDYNSTFLNPATHSDHYSTRYQQALNLGIYGADLGYTTIYNNTEDAMRYLSTIRRMAEVLDVAHAFDEQLMERFSHNIGIQDSMLVLVADAYRAGDDYLKNNDRNEVASLILTGGWIESLYFATRVVLSDKNPDIVARIGQQKGSLRSLIGLLSKNADTKSYNGLLAELSDLYLVFNAIKTVYTFNEPHHDIPNKTTTVSCHSTVHVTDEQLTAISRKIENIRKRIAG